MAFFINSIKDTGIWGLPVVGLFLLSSALLLVWFAMSIGKKNPPSLMVWLPICLMLLFSSAGVLVGLGQVMDAVEMAAPDQKQTLLAMGLSVANMPHLLPALLFFPAMCFVMVRGVHGLFLPPRNLVRAGASSGVWLLCLTLALLGGPAGIMVGTSQHIPNPIDIAILVQGFICLSMLFPATMPEGAEEGRTEGSFVAAFVAAASVNALVLCTYSYGIVDAFGAMATAQPDQMRQLVFAGGMQIQEARKFYIPMAALSFLPVLFSAWGLKGSRRVSAFSGTGLLALLLLVAYLAPSTDLAPIEAILGGG